MSLSGPKVVAQPAGLSEEILARQAKAAGFQAGGVAQPLGLGKH